MACGYSVYQGLYTYPVFSQVEWKKDKHLEPPELLYPGDGQNICTEPFDQEGKEYLDSTGCNLTWEAVTGATHYIVQWCEESSFAGPTLRSEQTADTNYHLLYRRDIRMGESLYWRVMAHDGDGGVSHKSEVRQFKWDCPTGKRPKPKSLGSDPGYCELFNITLELSGPGKSIHCCTRELFHLKITYDCKDSDGNDLVTFGGTSWSIMQNPDDANVSIAGSDNGSCIVESACEESSQFWLVACANFTVVATGESFQCCTAEEVTVDCDTSYAGYITDGGGKPWLKIDPRGTGDSTLGYPDPDSVGTPTTGYYEPGSVTGKPLVGKGRIAVGPCIQIKNELMASATRDPCKIDPGAPKKQAWEARVHLPDKWGADEIKYGCGLTYADGELIVNYGCGLTCADGELAVRYGCGLICKDGELSVSYSDGLHCDAGDMKVKLGCGVGFDGLGGVAVQHGCGLLCDEYDSMQIDFGCGLRCDGGPGDKLEVNYDGGLTCEDGLLRVNYGACLEIENDILQVATDYECEFDLFTLDPGSINFYTEGCSVFLQMSGDKWHFSKTNCGLLLGSCSADDTWQVSMGGALDCDIVYYTEVVYNEFIYNEFTYNEFTYINYIDGMSCYDCLYEYGLV